MSKIDNIERLFLLEILVDNVFISKSDLDLNPRILSSLKQTVVKFQFLNYPPLEICEEDFTPAKDKYDEEEISFKSGKSCLFALRGQRPAALSPPFNMDVTVCRMFESGKFCTIGRTCIKLGECFATIITCCIVCPTSPTSKTIKDTYPLKDDKNCEIGSITVFIRLSCFGKFIITQFQLGGLENKSFLFRAESDTNSPKKKEEPLTEDGFKTITPTQYKPGQSISKPETYCETIGGSTNKCGPCEPLGAPFSSQPSFMGAMGMPMMSPPGMGAMMPPSMMQPPGMGAMMPPSMMQPPGMGAMMGMPAFCGSGIKPPARQPMALLPVPGVGGGEPPTIKIAPTTDYKELTASVNGHELSIKILRKQKTKKEDFLSSDSPSSGEGNELGGEEVPIKRRSLKKYRSKKPCPLESGRGFGLKADRVKVKENYLLRLGNCPPVCYKMPLQTQDTKLPCITERDSQYIEEDMEAAKKLYEEFLKEQSKGKDAKGKDEKGKDAKGKGAKGKGKGKK